MPEGFQFPGGTGTLFRFAPPPRSDVWVPLALTANDLNQRSSHSLSVIARLKPGISLEQAGAEMNAIQQRLEQQYPNFFIGSHVKLVPLAEQASGTVRRSLLVLWVTVGFVLLIGCANVANLLLARAAARKKEMAVRAALGASRLRVLRQLLTESLLLAIAGGIGGILLALWGVAALSAIIPSDFPRREEIAIDYWVLGFTLLVSLLTGAIFGLAPALQLAKTELTEALKEGGRSGSDGAPRNRVRSLLVVAETALALVLLIGAALMMQSFLRLQRVNPGFRTDHVLTMELSLPPVRYARPQRVTFFQQLIERSRTLPGVQAVAASKHLPLTGDNNGYAFDIVGREAPPGQSPGADMRFVTPDYFSVLGIPLVKGRTFLESDGPDAPHVIVINQALASHFFPNENPIGKQVRLGINNFTGAIVGVVGDVKHVGLDAEVNDEVYTPYAQTPFWTDMTLSVRTSGDPLSLAATMREAVKALDNALPVSRQRTLEAIVAESVAQPRFRTLLLGLFGLAALLLASVGIYGVMSYAVVQRTHELGVRMALGAQAKDVLRLVIGQGMKLVLIGVALGLTASFGLTRLLEGLLFEVKATDPVTFAVIALLLTGIALLACYVPARRATQVDPLVALRQE
jgi:putative ABC transport system permease protein